MNVKRKLLSRLWERLDGERRAAFEARLLDVGLLALVDESPPGPVGACDFDADADGNGSIDPYDFDEVAGKLEYEAWFPPGEAERRAWESLWSSREDDNGKG